jgi:hypothetical protein
MSPQIPIFPHLKRSKTPNSDVKLCGPFSKTSLRETPLHLAAASKTKQISLVYLGFEHKTLAKNTSFQQIYRFLLDEPLSNNLVP